MRAFSAMFIALGVTACATALPAAIATGPGTVDIRYDQQRQTDADAAARAHCGGGASFVSGETRFDGFAYRTYRCAGR